MKRSLRLTYLFFAPLALRALDPTPAEITQYNGAAYGAFPVEYPSVPSGQANAIKLFGEYTLGDIDGDLRFMQSQNINKVKTYAHAIWSPVTDYTSGLQQYIDRNNTINADPTAAAAATALNDLNNPYETWTFITAGTKWIIPQAAAKGFEIYATANVTNGTIGSVPSNMPATVDIKYRVGGVVKTQTVTLTGISPALPGGYTSYTNAHWDVELAIATIANDRLAFYQPVDSSGSYTVATLAGKNRDYVKALIVGNEVLSTGGLTVDQVKNMVTFAKNRRDAYGLTAAELPITTCTNSLGNWQTMQTEVLPLIEGLIVFNTYGLPFVSVSGTDQAGTAGLSATNPAKSVGDNVINNISAFQVWLAGTSQSALQVVVGEHGYPSSTAAPDPNSLYSNTNAGFYYGVKSNADYAGVLSAIASKKVLCFFFEMFNEPWKDSVFPTTGTENFWGVSTASQSARRVLNTPFVPSSYEVWQYPETRAMKASYSNPLIPSPTTDSDIDGLTDNFEAIIIHALLDDGLTDYSHVLPSGDFDDDGLTELEEQTYGTSPILADSDGDFFTDKQEIDFGSDPLSKTSVPVTQELLSAIEYRFTTYLGLTYQVQYSDNLIDWENFGDPVIGDGEGHSVLIPLEGRSKSSENYRLVVNYTDQP